MPLSLILLQGTSCGETLRALTPYRRAGTVLTREMGGIPYTVHLWPRSAIFLNNQIKYRVHGILHIIRGLALFTAWLRA